MSTAEAVSDRIVSRLSADDNFNYIEDAGGFHRDWADDHRPPAAYVFLDETRFKLGPWFHEETMRWNVWLRTESFQETPNATLQAFARNLINTFASVPRLNSLADVQRANVADWRLRSEPRTYEHDVVEAALEVVQTYPNAPAAAPASWSGTNLNADGIVERLIDQMQADSTTDPTSRFYELPDSPGEGNYYREEHPDRRHPCVMVIARRSRNHDTFIGGTDHILHEIEVSFETRSERRTDTGTLYRLVDDLRAYLSVNPRIGDGAGILWARLASVRMGLGERSDNYLYARAICTVEVLSQYT